MEPLLCMNADCPLQEEGLVTRLKRPRAIVIVPSTELARQVLV
jgi:hypothetical protein